MSEYQYIAFRAIDAPVNKTNLEYMRRQSSRAKITEWKFENEYDFSDFNGNAPAMLRRGYDFHLHYANFGVRTLMIRLPNGLPDAKTAEPYFEKRSFDFAKDKEGPGGILRINPAFEAGYLDDLYDIEDFIDRLLPIRAEILNGDLRPLYLAYLAIGSDCNHDPDEEMNVPVPAGMNQLTKAQLALAEYVGLSPAFLTAAAKNSPPLADSAYSKNNYAAWLQRQPEATKTTWLLQLMEDPHAAVGPEMLTEYQKSQTAPSWATIPSRGTIAQLMTAADEIENEGDREEARKAARKRAKELADLAADPAKAFQKMETLMTAPGMDVYRQIAATLADLREALSGANQAGLAEEYARVLKEKYAKKARLTKELRNQGFLKK